MTMRPCTIFDEVLEHDVRAADDDEVAQHHAPSESDVLVLVDDGDNDVRAACTAVGVEHQPNARPHIMPPMMADMMGSSGMSGSVMNCRATVMSRVSMMTL